MTIQPFTASKGEEVRDCPGFSQKPRGESIQAQPLKSIVVRLVLAHINITVLYLNNI